VALAVVIVVFGIIAGGAAAGLDGGSASPTAAMRSAGSVTARIAIDPLRVTLALTSSTAATGTNVHLTESVLNGGKIALTGVSALIEPLSNVTVDPTRSQTIGTLSSGAKTSVLWTMCASTAGTYVVVAEATGHNRSGEDYVDYSPSERAVFTGDRRRCLT